MIRIVRGAPASTESLVGKFVLFDGGFIYDAFSNAREVISETDRSFVGRTFKRSKNADNQTVHAIAADDYEEATFRRSTVRCICDTLAEVDHVVATSRAARAMFDDAIAKTRELLATVDGVAVDDMADRHGGDI
jgi:hypothetical protein